MHRKSKRNANGEYLFCWRTFVFLCALVLRFRNIQHRDNRENLGAKEMKIVDNGIVRDMTAEEEEAFYKDPEPTAEDKAEAYDILTGGAP